MKQNKTGNKATIKATTKCSKVKVIQSNRKERAKASQLTGTES